MKKILFTIMVFIAASNSAVAAPFAPTLLKLNASKMLGYDFDGSTLSFPVEVTGSDAGIIFSVFTKDRANSIGNTVNGYLGWHHVNKVDTCIYFSTLKSVHKGETTIEWDGKDMDGNYVPAGEYTYYLWAFDNQGAKQKMTNHMNSGWGFDFTTKIQEVDETGLPLANPIWYRPEARWIIGSNPEDESLKETTNVTGILPDSWKWRGDPTMLPTNFRYCFLSVQNSDAQQASIIKVQWVPNGDADIQTDFGDNGFADIYATVGGGSPGTCTDGNYLYTADENHTTSNEPDSEFYIYDYDGTLVEVVDLSPWWSSYDDFEAGGQMNGGPNNFDERGGFVFLNCHCNCLNQMVAPQRYLETGDVDDFFVWSNGNGDYTLDHNFEETAAMPWTCNDYNVGPYKYSVSPDANLFTAVNAYDVGAVSFGLLAPDGTGLGFFAFAGETAGMKSGQKFLDSGTPFDGIYCDNRQSRRKLKPTDVEYRVYNTPDEAIYFLGHDSIKGVLSQHGSSSLPNRIDLAFPNGGETVKASLATTITWSVRDIEEVSVSYSTDGGTSWTMIVDSIDASIGSYQWTVPDISSNNCRVKIADAEIPERHDISDWTFTIAGPPKIYARYAAEVSNTGNNATIMIEAENIPRILGEAIVPGDNIGIFTPRGLCAGAANWSGDSIAITVWGDDAYTDGVAGFQGSELLSFKLWDVSEQKEYSVTASYDRGDGLYVSNGIYILSSLETAVVDFVLDFNSGWNIVSLPVIPDDRTLQGMFSVIEDDLIMIKNGRGDIYWPEYGVDTIVEWAVGDGYKIYMETPSSLTIKGHVPFTPDIDIDLIDNWNLISYPGEDDVAPADAFESISGNLIIVKNGRGEIFWPEFGIDQIGGMKRGEGYWIYMSSPISFSYPATAPIQNPGTAYKQPHYFTPVSATGNNATIYIRPGSATGKSGGLADGDEIGVLTVSGVCAGAGVWSEEKGLAFTVWGDNDMTDEVDGLSPGEPFAFVIRDIQSGEELEADAVFSDDSQTYDSNVMIILESLHATDHPIQVEDDTSPTAFSLSQNSPNPFNPVTTIPFTLPDESAVTLTVYNIAGEKVVELIDGSLGAGNHSVDWDASGVGSGLYFARLRAGEFVETVKMTVVK